MQLLFTLTAEFGTFVHRVDQEVANGFGWANGDEQPVHGRSALFPDWSQIFDHTQQLRASPAPPPAGTVAASAMKADKPPAAASNPFSSRARLPRRGASND